MKIIAFLPAKGSSSRIESKNVKLLDGKPLFLHTLEKLVECDFIDEIYLDTESEEIISLADGIDCKILKRNPQLASNTTDGHKLFMNEVNHIEADIYIQILCTSPFISKETLKKGIDSLINNNNYDSCVLVRKEKMYLWKHGKPTYNLSSIPNSNTLDDTIIETMGLYIVRRETALSTRRRIGDKPLLLECSPLEAIDVNYPEDFDLANLIAAGKREKERKLFINIKNRLTSAMLSDILDEYGIKGVLKGFQLNLKNKKVLGTAKTLKIRKLKEGEDIKGIYDALKSYDTIIPNDIIIVENEISDFAYFGELNANLAIRSGAIAAIIDGMTRDTKEVAELDFPVFSKGSTCKDVKGRATVDSINQEITIQNVKIKRNDFIFGDNDGIIIIPKKYVDQVMKKAFDIINIEKKILFEIANGSDITSIINNQGLF
jgi:CMP-N-acetylneuraminic acid synthetase/regulator of RNase E activity RraA